MVSKLMLLVFTMISFNLSAGVGPIPKESFVQKNAKGTILNPKGAKGDDWFNESPSLALDSKEGVSVDKAYSEFGTGKSTVVVAVIDSGVDINHEDLQGQIWYNKDEIPNNGIDDDRNGYIDDYAGWNFLGSKKGMGNFQRATNGNGFVFQKGNPEYQIGYETFEITRELVRMKKLRDEQGLSPDQDRYLAYVQKIYNALAARTIFNPEYRKYYLNEDYVHPVRSLIEEEKKVTPMSYGNNDVIGPDSSHGTHVSGIIAAVRSNGLGIDGIASKVKIMALRAVPDGDERDEDIAYAIKYAVDNGARIINMSFGKVLSPKKDLVNKAVAYAEKKGVILIHAAGNDGKEVTFYNNFPNKLYEMSRNGSSYLSAKNWIEVGASTAKTSSLAAYFSNYSKPLVNVFAPGHNILSTTPGNNYDSYSGTSMASPVVAGAFAYIASLFPKVSNATIKEYLLGTSRKYKDLVVQKPKVGPFSGLSKTGGVIDVYQALKMLSLKY